MNDELEMVWKEVGTVLAFNWKDGEKPQKPQSG
jgi:hypothetical protein